MAIKSTSAIAWPGEFVSDPDETALVSDIIEETTNNIFCLDESKTEVRYAEVRGDDPSAPRVEVANSREEICDWFEDEDESEVKPNDSYPRARFFSVYPVGQQGRGRLAITRPSMLYMLGHLNVFPSFYRSLAVYQNRLYATDESFGRLDYEISQSSENNPRELELCYLMKYVERRTERSAKQWSFRQCLLYQKVRHAQGDPEILQKDHILVRPGQKMRDRLSARMYGPQRCDSGIAFDWTGVHCACWSGIDWGFREMTVELDELVTEIADNITLFSISVSEQTKVESSSSVAKDMKALQSVIDKLCRLRSVIKVNLHTLKALSKMCKSLLSHKNDRKASHHRPPGREEAARIKVFIEKLGKWKREHHFADAHAATILERANNSSNQLSQTVAMRINELNRVSSDAIFEMTQKSSHEANIVKFLTVLASIFIPASFCADFLQMGYVKLSPDANFRLEADSDLKIYAMLAFPLVFVTVALYGFAEGLKSRSLKKQREKRQNSVLEEGEVSESDEDD